MCPCYHYSCYVHGKQNHFFYLKNRNPAHYIDRGSFSFIPANIPLSKNHLHNIIIINKLYIKEYIYIILIIVYISKILYCRYVRFKLIRLQSKRTDKEFKSYLYIYIYTHINTTQFYIINILHLL